MEIILICLFGLLMVGAVLASLYCGFLIAFNIRIMISTPKDQWDFRYRAEPLFWAFAAIMAVIVSFSRPFDLGIDLILPALAYIPLGMAIIFFSSLGYIFVVLLILLSFFKI